MHECSLREYYLIGDFTVEKVSTKQTVPNQVVMISPLAMLHTWGS